jgi:hypothetical protein
VDSTTSTVDLFKVSVFRDADFALEKLDDYAGLAIDLGMLDDKQLLLL